MVKRIKWDLNKARKYIENETSWEYLEGDYKNAHSIFTLRCKCGKICKLPFTKIYHRKRSHCPDCSWEKLSKDRRYDTKWFKNKVEEIFGDEYTVLGEYKNNRTKILIRHNSEQCNYREYEVIPYAVTDFGHGCRECHYLNNKGENSPSWNPNLTNEERIINRDYFRYNKWRKTVYERDNYTCQKCNSYGGRLAAHHIYNYSTHKNLRLDTNNGITLCYNCHKKFHDTYGYRNNNQEQIVDYLSH